MTRPGPARPGLRLGVEQEGRYAGKRTLVILGYPRWQAVNRAIRDHQPEHVFWETPQGRQMQTFAGWSRVRSFVRRGLTVTVNLPVWEVNGIPPRLSSVVEVMINVPSTFERVDALKVDHGGFRVRWHPLSRLWRETQPQAYEADLVILPKA